MTTVCLSFDFDALSLWLMTFQSTDPAALSRGEYGARVAAPRLLEWLAKRELPSTWFVPGHTAETYPAITAEIARRGHEIGAHGYCHESPARLRPEREIEVLERSLEALERITGQRAVGYRSPGSGFSPQTTRLLVERGFLYDSSLMGDDFRPYWCRSGDVPSKTEPFRFGPEIPLVELPFHWVLDDFPHFEYLPGPTYHQGLAAPSQVLEIWREEFRYAHEEMTDAIFVLTMHPQVIGRASRLSVLDRLVAEVSAQPGVEFATMESVARRWAAGQPGRPELPRSAVDAS